MPGLRPFALFISSAQANGGINFVDPVGWVLQAPVNCRAGALSIFISFTLANGVCRVTEMKIAPLQGAIRRSLRRERVLNHSPNSFINNYFKVSVLAGLGKVSLQTTFQSHISFTFLLC